MAQKPISQNITVSILINASDRNRIIAKVIFTNNGDRNFYLDKINEFADGKMKNNLFEISCDGKKVPYKLPLANRTASKYPDDFVKINPNKSFTTETILNEAYKFPQGNCNCTISYSAFNYNPSEDRLVELKSEKVEFSIV